MVCPTCGFFLGQYVEKYEQQKEQIFANPKLSSHEKSEELTKLTKGLKLRRYCCKMRFMTYKDLVKDIQPISDPMQN